MEMFNNVYRDKTVLITGHTGFKGSWLSIWLKELGANVVGYALEPYTERDNFVVTGLENKITHIIGDVKDYEKLKEVFLKYKPEFVFHLAAQPLVRESYVNPKETYDVNIGGTVNLFECCRLTDSVKVIINVTSDKCYENKEWIWGYRENDHMGGYDPYSSSKGCSEIITAAYRSSFFNPNNFKDHGKSISSVRAGNVIGGGDWQKDRLIPDCIRALENNEVIKIRNPDSIRPWQYVIEPLSGYLLLASKMFSEGEKFQGGWNFGPNDTNNFSVLDLVKSIIEIAQKGSYKFDKKIEKLHETTLLKLDISKAINFLGWKPTLNFYETVEFTVKGYLNENEANVYEKRKQQILDYFNLAKQKDIHWSL